MITRARFVNFKALRDVEVPFDSRLTVLVGPNGSGKTSVLEGMHLLSQFASGGQKEDIFSAVYQLGFLAGRMGGNADSPTDMAAVVDFTEEGSAWQFQVVSQYTPPAEPDPDPMDDGWRCRAQHRKVGDVSWV